VQLNRRSIRFRPSGQSEGFAWTVFQVIGRDCLLFVHPEAQRRRLTPVPNGWEQLGEAALTDLLNRATPAPAPVSLLPMARKRTPEPVIRPLQPLQESKDDLWALEHEQRLATEELLGEAHDALQGMERDLESAKAELRTMDEELQDMAETIRQLAQTPPSRSARKQQRRMEAGRNLAPGARPAPPEPESPGYATAPLEDDFKQRVRNRILRSG
jgi:hypothetical protein